MVTGRVVQFRRGRRTYTIRHFLLEIPTVDTKVKALKFVGKPVEWKSPGNKVINGKIAATHGTKGVLRAIFDQGLPGQSIGTPVEVKA